jgi:hypothetical protein
MSKVSMVRLYNAEDVPDAIVHEVQLLVDKIGKCLLENIANHNPNIILSAFNRYHAKMIIALVEDGSLEDATATEALALVKNVEHLSGKKILPEEKD